MRLVGCSVSTEAGQCSHFTQPRERPPRLFSILRVEWLGQNAPGSLALALLSP
jgi:hypothetical protein